MNALDELRASLSLAPKADLACFHAGQITVGDLLRSIDAFHEYAGMLLGIDPEPGEQGADDEANKRRDSPSSGA